MDKQYDVPPEIKKLYEIKQKQRAEAKEYFQKIINNPYRPINDGIPPDPAILRFGALQAYRYQLYEATPKFYCKVLIACSPFILFYWGMTYIKASKDATIKSGLISYEDRYDKFIR